MRWAQGSFGPEDGQPRKNAKGAKFGEAESRLSCECLLISRISRSFAVHPDLRQICLRARGDFAQINHRGTEKRQEVAEKAKFYSEGDGGGIDRILSERCLFAMKTVSYTDARNRLSTLMESAVRDREPITITRNGAGTVVMLAEW